MSITVLELTKQILSSMDSDDVAGIGDTTEATQVATLIKEVYEELVTEYDVRSAKKLFQLDASGDVTKPAIMTIPAGYHSIEWIRYNTRTLDATADNWVVVSFLPENDFMEYCITRLNDASDTNIVNMAIEGSITIPILNNVAPFYWTTYDDNKIIFDSYDASISSTLLQSMTNCYGTAPPNLILDDEEIIGLPTRLITTLRNEVRARAFDLWKDGVPSKVEQAAMRSRVRLQRQRYAERLTDQEKKPLPDYGRK